MFLFDCFDWDKTSFHLSSKNSRNKTMKHSDYIHWFGLGLVTIRSCYSFNCRESWFLIHSSSFCPLTQDRWSLLKYVLFAGWWMASWWIYFYTTFVFFKNPLFCSMFNLVEWETYVDMLNSRTITVNQVDFTLQWS